jgi:hypothetical protein
MGWHQATALAMLCASVWGSAFAQDTATLPRQAEPATAAPLGDTTVRQPAPGGVPGLPFNPKLCPNPQPITLSAPTSTSGPTPAAPNPIDFSMSVAGSMFNQTQVNKPFGHTFNFTRPSSECCQYADGLLTVTYKVLGDLWPNDGGGPVRNGSGYQTGLIWANVPNVHVGTTVTKTYPIPASWIASGRVSFGVQDDTAVVRATLQINGCCLTPTPPAR